MSDLFSKFDALIQQRETLLSAIPDSVMLVELAAIRRLWTSFGNS